MKLFFTAFFLAMLMPVFAEHTSNICPSRCNADRTLTVRECNNPVTRSLCEIAECDGGFSCSLPGNAFLIANTQLELVEMVLEYSWSPEQRDLDTSTRFLNAIVGFACFSMPNEYLEFGGDNSSHGGSEVAVVDFDKARRDGAWTGSTSVIANAGWFNFENQGSAQLKVSLRSKSSGAVVAGATLSDRIQPGTQSECSTTKVAEVKIVRGSLHTRVTLELA